MEGSPRADSEPLASVSSDSVTEIVDKGWNLISHNTEILLFLAVGFVGTLAEAAGYRPFVRLNDLLPPVPPPEYFEEDAVGMNITKPVDMTTFTGVYEISRGVDLVGKYTVHIYLACYILLPYPVITEKQKVLLTPWLVLSLVRSLLREMVITLVGIVLCASHDVFYYPCIQYSALQGAQFCFILYFWTSVHNFYHYLDKKNSADLNKVIETIHKGGLVSMRSFNFSPRISEALSVDMDDDEEHTEATLVERAAMAWIAREILEGDGEYVTDKQFSQYLAIKATMELRQAIKELAEKKSMVRKATKMSTTKEKIEESLEFMKMSEKRPRNISRPQAFDHTGSFFKRDPIRRIRPLPTFRMPVIEDNESFTSGASTFSYLTTATTDSTSTVSTETQTEPPTHQMARLLDMLEWHQQQRRFTQELKELKELKEIEERGEEREEEAGREEGGGEDEREEQEGGEE